MVHVAGLPGGSDTQPGIRSCVSEITAVTQDGRKPASSIRFDSMQAEAPRYISGLLQPSHSGFTVAGSDGIVTQHCQDSRLAHL
jgi:hypothetical protein